MAKVHSTTQNFTEVIDVIDDIVFFKGKNAASIIDVSSVNFFLLSQDEQNARIYGYMSLLNSLSFPIQILIVSKRIDLSFYVKLLDQKIKNAQSARFQEHLTLYKEFIQELIKGGDLLDKKIYIIIPFSYLELGAVGAATTTGMKKASLTQKIREILTTKRNSVITQIERIGLSARIVGGEELTKLLYELFNSESINISFDSQDVKNVIL